VAWLIFTLMMALPEGYFIDNSRVSHSGRRCGRRCGKR